MPLQVSKTKHLNSPSDLFSVPDSTHLFYDSTIPKSLMCSTEVCVCISVCEGGGELLSLPIFILLAKLSTFLDLFFLKKKNIHKQPAFNHILILVKKVMMLIILDWEKKQEGQYSN